MKEAMRTSLELSPAEVLKTAVRLEKRIAERFPENHLRQVAKAVAGLSADAERQARRLGRPNYLLRCLFLLLIAAGGYFAWQALRDVNLKLAPATVAELAQGVESGVNDVILLLAGLYFLFSLDVRLKRNKALKLLNKLRSLVHVIDMHQLDKDPDRIFRPKGVDTENSPPLKMNPFELGRYLDYCSELLSLTGKVAAIYAQHITDPAALDMVAEIERLSGGFSGKIWVKMEILAEQHP